jgi:hypothetical protein
MNDGMVYVEFVEEMPEIEDVAADRLLFKISASGVFIRWSY